MNGEMLVFHIVCAVLVTGFAVLATGQLARLYGLCGWQANAYMKEFYERHLKSCWILLLMAVEYIAISLIEAEGAWQIIIWAVFLVAVCVEGWLYLKKIRWDGERTPGKGADRRIWRIDWAVRRAISFFGVSDYELFIDIYSCYRCSFWGDFKAVCQKKQDNLIFIVSFTSLRIKIHGPTTCF